MTECENAKDVFGGRLTPDMVAEKLGHSNYSDVVDLNLQSSAIRSLSIVYCVVVHYSISVTFLDE